jgi:hypothetical protein
MLDQERIPIRKLKQAFELNEQDAETVIASLWPDRVFPYALWEMAYLLRWKDAASRNTVFYKAKKSSPFPTFDPSEHELSLLHIYSDRIIRFFSELSAILFAAELREGFDRILNLTYEKNDNVFHEDIEYIFTGLSRIESELNLGIHRPFTWATNITAERFHEVFEAKAIFVASYNLAFLSKIFLDAVVVDKTAAIRHLIDGGYSWRQAVKGISRTVVERITAKPSTPQAQDAPVLHVQDDFPKTLAPSAILVSRSLWDGKSEKAVRDNMRQQDFTDPVIAYVLHNWRDLKNKTQIGRLLGPDGQNDSTYLRLAHRLLAEAATLNIQHA